MAASTQNQALSTLLFLYREVLHQDLGANIDAIRAKRPKNLPTVLTPDEALAVIARLSGDYRLVAQLLYGSGLRLKESLRLRVKDLDFAQNQITVMQAKGGDSRFTMLPACLVDPLKEHLQGVKRLHQQDLGQGHGSVYLPYALERKYPSAVSGFGSMFFLRASSRSILGVKLPVATISMTAASKKPLSKRLKKRTSINASVVIPFAIALRPICSKMATTFALFKNCSVTKMSRPL